MRRRRIITDLKSKQPTSAFQAVTSPPNPEGAGDDLDLLDEDFASEIGSDSAVDAGTTTQAEVWEDEVPADLAGQRLDRVLAALHPQLSRSRLQKWVQAEQVWVNGKVASVRQSVFVGDRIRVQPQPDPSEVAFKAQDVPLDVVYQDDQVFVLNKPAGLVVHPGNGNWEGTVLNGLLHLDGSLSSIPRAGIVHRLDKDTTGLMVVARTLEAQTSLVRQLQERSVKREYVCLVWGHAPASGQVDAPIGRDPKVPTRMAVREDGHSKPAMTYFECLARGVMSWQGHERAVSWVQCRLATGRTHQIRVHMQSINLPLLGDAVYLGKSFARAQLPIPRQALHAQRLQFMHPSTQELIGFEAPVPQDLLELKATVQWLE